MCRLGERGGEDLEESSVALKVVKQQVTPEATHCVFGHRTLDKDIMVSLA